MKFKISTKLWVIICLSNYFSGSLELNAGLYEYSYLDEVNGWIIERKIDVETNEVNCRASIPSYGTWFSERTRLNENNELIVISTQNKKKIIQQETVNKVIEALNICRSGLIYLPLEP